MHSILLPKDCNHNVNTVGEILNYFTLVFLSHYAPANSKNISCYVLCAQHETRRLMLKTKRPVRKQVFLLLRNRMEQEERD